MTNFKIVIKRIFITALILIFILGIYSLFIEQSFLRVKHEKLYLPNYSPELNGLKVAIISDIHIGGQFTGLKKLKRYTKEINAQSPDFIFFLGDLDSLGIIKSKTNKNEISSILSKLNAKYGVISVLGNHDISPDIVKPILLNANISLLEDEKLTYTINNKPLTIYGLKDMWHFHPEPKEVVKVKNSEETIILLSHNPDLFPEVPDFVSLTLSGHLHGGQVYLPILGGIFTPSIWGQRYNKGYIVENNKHIYVTSGVGGSVILRFGILPEIVILELYSLDSFPEKRIENTPELKGIQHSLNSIGLSVYIKIMRLLNIPF